MNALGRYLLATVASLAVLAVAVLVAYGLFLLLRFLGRYALLAGLAALPLLWMARRWNRAKRQPLPPRLRF